MIDVELPVSRVRGLLAFSSEFGCVDVTTSESGFADVTVHLEL